MEQPVRPTPVEDTAWIVLTFETSNDNKPVDEFIKNQQPQARAKIAHAVRLLRQHGNRLGMPHSKALGSGLYELRIRGKEELRILYGFMTQKTIYLLHAFKKQTQETPQKELNLALQRIKNLTST